MTKQIISTKMENVKCVIGQNTKQPNTITMRVPETEIIEAVNLFKTLREGNKPESGLLGYELVAVYADGSDKKEDEIIELKLSDDAASGEDLVDGLIENIEGVLT